MVLDLRKLGLVYLTQRLQNFGGFLMPNIINFLKEVKEELVKVAWPSREQTIRYTILVIIVAVLVGLFLGGLDYILTIVTAFILENYGR